MRCFLVAKPGLRGALASVLVALGPGRYGSWAPEHKLRCCASGLRCPEARGISLDRGPEPVSPASALYVTRPPGKPSSPLQGSCSADQPGVSGRRPAGEGPHEGTRGPLLRTVPWEARLSLTSSLRNGMTAKILIRDLHVPQV